MGANASFPGLVEMVVDSGIFGYLILAYGLALAAAIVQQFRKASEKDFSALLWGMIVGLVSVGILGTVIGQVHACAAYLSMGEGADAQLLILAWRVSLGPVVLASLFAAVGGIATGIASTRARRHALRPA